MSAELMRKAIAFAQRRRSIGDNENADVIEQLIAKIKEDHRFELPAGDPESPRGFSSTIARVTMGTQTIDDVARLRSYHLMVTQMRDAQKDYFRNRTHDRLTAARDLESKVDNFWKESAPKQEALI